MMPAPPPPSPVGTIILLAVLLFIVFRILRIINSRSGANRRDDNMAGLPEEENGRVFHLPERKAPLPPKVVTLQKRDESEPDPFENSELAEHCTALLTQKEAFNFLGDYTLPEMAGYVLRVYSHPTKNMVAIIYKDPLEREWVNFLTEYEDGRLVTSTSAEKELVGGNRPQGMPVFIFPGLEISQLLRRHKLETRGIKQAEPVTENEFGKFFISKYNRLRDHIAGQEYEKNAADGIGKEGQLLQFPDAVERDEEVEIDLSSGSDKKEPANAPPLPGREKTQAEYVPTSRDRQRWLKEIYRAIDLPQTKREKFQQGLVWVLNNASMNSVAETMKSYADVSVTEVENGRWIIRSSEGAEDIIEPGSLKGSALFDKVNASLPKKSRLFKLPVELDNVAFYSVTSPGKL